MNEVNLKQQILNKIKEYQSIIIARHVKPDGDAMGSSLGLARILRILFQRENLLCRNNES